LPPNPLVERGEVRWWQTNANEGRTDWRAADALLSVIRNG
jgi:hypothetical protein